MRAVCLGEALFDFIATDNVPLSQATHYVRCLGGAAVNVAVGLHSHDIETTLVSRVGRDQLGWQVLHELKQLGLSTSFIQVDTKRSTKCSFLSHDGAGNRFIEIANRQSADQQIDLLEMRKAFADPFDVLYISGVLLIQERGLNLVMESIKMAKHCGAFIAFDPVFDVSNAARPVRMRVFEVLEHVDILKVNEVEYKGLFPRLKRPDTRPPLILYTKGAEGAEILTRTTYADIDTVEATCIDPTGAGDAFLVGFLTSFLNDHIQSNLKKKYTIPTLKKWGKQGALNAARIIEWIGSSRGYQ